MNVIPKKRAHQILQNLTLLRNPSLSRSVSVLRNLTLPRKLANSQSMKSMRNLHLKIPSMSIFNYRVIWFSASLFMYGWFLSWIAYDIFFWHKSITQVSLTNYVGAITAMALIWGGTIFFKTPKHIVVKLPQKQKTIKERTPKKRTHKPSKLKTSIPSQIKQLSLVQSEHETEPVRLLKPPVETVAISSKCSRRIKNSLEIPDHCLVCPELIQCLAKVGK